MPITVAEEEINKQCIVFRLPSHLVKDIIRNLDSSAKIRAREACKLFQVVIDLNWDDIPIFNKFGGDVAVLQEMLVEKAEKISSINWQLTSIELVEILPEKLPKLTVLKVRSITHFELEKIYQLAPNLNDLGFSLDQWSIALNHSFNKKLWSCLPKFKQLTALRIEGGFEMTTENHLMDFLQERGPNITCFSIRYIHFSSPDVVTCLLTPLRNSLTELLIWNEDEYYEDILAISRCWKLKKLHLCYPSYSHRGDFNHLAKLTSLEDFEITNNGFSGYSSMHAFLDERQKNNCVPLRRLAIGNSSMQDNEIDKLLDLCPKLTVLQLENCYCVSGKYIDGWIAKCPMLSSLTLKNCGAGLAEKLTEGELRRHKENTRVNIVISQYWQMEWFSNL